MSYFVTASFRHCDSLEKAFSIAHKLCSSIRNNNELVERLIKNNSNKIPSNWRSFERKQNHLDGCFSWWDRDWIRSFFSYRFVFWKKQNLLALYNENEPDFNSFFPLTVAFQNGTDHDYEFKEWINGNIPYFKNLVELFKGYTNKKIINLHKKKYGNEPFLSDLDYYRRSALYIHIYDNLQIDKLIFGEKGNFIEFAMSPINSAETNDNFYQILKKYIKEPSEDKIEHCENKILEENLEDIRQAFSGKMKTSYSNNTIEQITDLYIKHFTPKVKDIYPILDKYNKYSDALYKELNTYFCSYDKFWGWSSDIEPRVVKQLFDFYTLELRKEKVDEQTFIKKFVEYRNRELCQK